MSNDLPRPQQSEEVDLGQLFKLIGKAFNRLFISFLRLFLFFKKNLIALSVIIVVGLGLSYFLSNISTTRKKIEIIVKPNFESKDYLYSIVKEIQSKIDSRDYAFFDRIGIDLHDLHDFKIEIEPVKERDSEKDLDLELDLKYLSFLGSQENSNNQVLINEFLAKRNVNLNYKISFYYKSIDNERSAVLKIMEYINDNDYFKELKDIYLTNLEEKINENNRLIKQVDVLVENYSNTLNSTSKAIRDESVFLGGENGLDIPALLEFKNNLISNTALNKLNLKEQKNIIRVMYFGKAQGVKSNLFKYGLFLIPTILIGLFFAWTFLTFLNRKAKEL
ncbi:hypothetical protein QLS71_006905 [Mariniflexile litorale]|uniref:Polysaccharide chain length determinant N-terminal domain-containing protein n=1 Tax=Mariniflexile litorale TaxID=3045158 RepID=A0AAU7EKN7_9FLAO|nr:hypothetical protein [Mariniflexile sp. KMM 9835]MDQ8211323.1 hypothetical protein [Mariniflexile sp. KMM 9835]